MTRISLRFEPYDFKLGRQRSISTNFPYPRQSSRVGYHCIMKCVVALALALTAQAVDVDWKIPVAQPSVTVDKATDATITFKWNGFHSVFEVPSKAAMDSCDFTDAQEIAPQSRRRLISKKSTS